MKAVLKGIFFDLDGVIIDSAPLWDYIIDTIIDKYTLNTDVLKETDGYNLSTEEAIRTILKYSNRYTLSLYLEILACIDRLYTTNFKKKTSLIDSIPDVLDWLKEQGKTLVLVSNSSRVQVDLIVSHYQLNNYFDCIITSDDVTKGKPDKEPYIKALQLSELKKSEIWVVEDSLTGINSAKNAGLNYIAVNNDNIPNENTIRHSMLLEYIKEHIC